jgi:hypothetical protein
MFSIKFDVKVVAICWIEDFFTFYVLVREKNQFFTEETGSTQMFIINFSSFLDFFKLIFFEIIKIVFLFGVDCGTCAAVHK